MLRIIDASSIITGWDSYSITILPTIWNWLREEIRAEKIAIPSIILKEVLKNSPACHAWLKDQNIKVLRRTGKDIVEAARIMTLLQISNGQYGKGVGENDIILISMAMNRQAILLSDEARQPILPGDLKSYKIPAVCQMNTVNVQCLSFYKLLLTSGQVF